VVALAAGAVLFALLAGTADAAGTGSISGTVTGGATEGTLMVPGACVAAYDSDGNQVAYQGAASDGHYEIDGLSAGAYRLEFIDCALRFGQPLEPNVICVGANAIYCMLPGLPSEFYDNKRTLESATPVSVTEGQETTGIDANLGVAGGISGTVVDANFGVEGGISGMVTDDSGKPLDGVCVDAYYLDGHPAGVSGYTNSAGQYKVRSLEYGYYTLKFSNCLPDDDPSAIVEYYNDQPTDSTADLVFVDEDIVTTGIDAQLTTSSEPPVSETPDPTVYKAAIGKVTVKGPARVRKGRVATFKVKIANSGNIEASAVNLKVRGKGARVKVVLGTIPPGSARTVKAKVKPKKSGKAKFAFKVTSANAGHETVRYR
jgi:hypothetical protein